MQRNWIFSAAHFFLLWRNRSSTNFLPLIFCPPLWTYFFLEGNLSLDFWLAFAIHGHFIRQFSSGPAPRPIKIVNWGQLMRPPEMVLCKVGGKVCEKRIERCNEVAWIILLTSKWAVPLGLFEVFVENNYRCFPGITSVRGNSVFFWEVHLYLWSELMRLACFEFKGWFFLPKMGR